MYSFDKKKFIIEDNIIIAKVITLKKIRSRKIIGIS